MKRFDAGRGFGFVELDSGGDAFLHVSVLQRSGSDSVAPGARLRVRWNDGQKGPQVVEVLHVEGADAASPRRQGEPSPSSGRRDVAGRRVEAPDHASRSEVEVRGTVKWYSAEKGFGFVTPEDGGRDVFVHATALERSGMPPLTDGQMVTMRVVQGKKGLEAEEVATVGLGA